MDEAESQETLPGCFGDIEKVFPMGSRGLRETPDDCMYLCPHKTPCLRRAMAGMKGLDVKEEMVSQREKKGALGFFERWSKKKNIHRQKKIMEKKHDISKRT